VELLCDGADDHEPQAREGIDVAMRPIRLQRWRAVRKAQRRLQIDGRADAATVVGYGERSVRPELDLDALAAASQELVDAVRDDLEKASRAAVLCGVSQIHPRPQPHPLRRGLIRREHSKLIPPVSARRDDRALSDRLIPSPKDPLP
jgi:hypothetical protein